MDKKNKWTKLLDGSRFTHTHNRGNGFSSRKVGPPKYVLPTRKARMSNIVLEKTEDIKKREPVHSRNIDSIQEFCPSKSDLEKQPNQQEKYSFRIFHQRLNEFSRFKIKNGHGKCLLFVFWGEKELLLWY